MRFELFRRCRVAMSPKMSVARR